MRYYSLLLTGLAFLLLGFVWNKQGEISPDPAKPITERVVLKTLLHLDQSSGRVYDKGMLFTGTAYKLYANGQASDSISFVEGKKHGIYRKWFPNGMLSYEAEFIEGRREGSSRTWWRNGKLRSESTFQEGLAHGTQMQWYQSGAKFKKRNLAFGKESGIQQAWRENGKIYNNYEAKNGRIFGLKRASLCYALEEEDIQFGD